MNALIKSLNTFGVEESCVCYDQVVNVNSHYQRFTSILFQCKDTRITYGSNKHIVAKLATEGDEEPSMTDHAGENSLYGICHSAVLRPCEESFSPAVVVLVDMFAP